jgi:predicted RNase H-like nuclease
MPAFIGLDLAWTDHHESGVCVLVGDAEGMELRVLDAFVGTPEGFAALCCSYGPEVVVAVDAPLIVTPERSAEAALAKVFGKYKASAYSANLAFLQKMGGLAGPWLAQELCALGFSVVPSGLVCRRGPVAVEVYPHAAHIRLFDLLERLPYKKGTLARRKHALRHYQRYLGRLLGGELRGVLEHPELQQLLDRSALDVPGKVLKRLEDKLDAVTCACVAYHLWRHGEAGFELFGSDEHGAIVVPRVPPVLHAVGGGHAHKLQDASEGNA